MFEFRYRSVAMLQARGVVPPPKRELPLVIDLEDEDDEPLPKRQKTEHDKDLIRTMQVRGNSKVVPARPPDHRNRQS